MQQSQADIIRIPVKRPSMHEITALGAATAAALAVGIWSDPTELSGLKRSRETTFGHQISESESKSMYKSWSKAVEMSRGWVEHRDSETV